MLDDQPPVGIEDKHAVIAEARCEYLIENAERVVNAQRIRRLAKAYSGNLKGWPSLDQDDFHASPCEGCGSRQSADTAPDHQNASNVAHDRHPTASFRGARRREPGIQKHGRCLHLDSGSCAFARVRNDRKWGQWSQFRYR
jgi:hypothetical protein